MTAFRLALDSSSARDASIISELHRGSTVLLKFPSHTVRFFIQGPDL